MTATAAVTYTPLSEMVTIMDKHNPLKMHVFYITPKDGIYYNQRVADIDLLPVNRLDRSHPMLDVLRVHYSGLVEKAIKDMR